MIFHLLIVDDESIFRKGLSEYINWETYVVLFRQQQRTGNRGY